MQGKWRNLAIWCMIGVLLCGGCAVTSRSTKKQVVRLAMGFIPNVQFTPFYVAIERGYFADEGIEISLDYGMEHDLLKLVGMDELQFVVGSGDQVIMARSQGLPVVYVLNWYRRFPVSVVSFKPLHSPQDLPGLKVGIPGLYGASYIGWQAMLVAAGVDAQSINLVSIGYTQVESLVTGQVDAAVVYAMNEPVQLAQQGYQFSQLLVDDYADFVSNGLITNERTIRRDPRLVQGMVRAVLRGLQDTLADPDAAFVICRRYVPAIDEQSAPLQRAVLQAALDFWRADDPAFQLGQSDPAVWEASEAFMRQAGMLSEKQDVSAMFDNQFIPRP